jgi:hypothetical protein
MVFVENSPTHPPFRFRFSVHFPTKKEPIIKLHRFIEWRKKLQKKLPFMFARIETDRKDIPTE